MFSKQDYMSQYGADYVNMSLKDAGKCVIWYCTKQGVPYIDRLTALFGTNDPWEEVPPAWYKDWDANGRVKRMPQ